MNIRTKLNLIALVVIGELANITYIRSTPLFKMADRKKPSPKVKLISQLKLRLAASSQPK